MSLKIVSPMEGWAGSLAEVPDPVFSEFMMGDGVAIDPIGDVVSAPCDGVIINVADSRHSVTLRADNGAEILIHVGLETVALAGQGFTSHVEVGVPVKAGQPLLSFDVATLAASAKSMITPILLINGDEFEMVKREVGAVVRGGFLFEIQARVGVAVTTSDAGVAQEMVVQDVAIPLAHGIHARPAARLCALVRDYQSEFSFSRGEKATNGLSPVGLMALGLKCGDMLTVQATGKDANDALADVIEAIEAGLGETPVALASFTEEPPAEFVQKEEVVAAEHSLTFDGTTYFHGVTAAPGQFLGPSAKYELKQFNIAEMGGSAEEELSALELALGKVEVAMHDAMEKGGEQQEILTAHLALLRDDALLSTATALIREGKSAGYSWRVATHGQVELLRSLGDPLLAERAIDLLDIEQQVLAEITGEGSIDVGQMDGKIILATELLPSQFIRLADAGIAGICLVYGGPTSHVSILAADRGIPALVAVSQAVLSVPDGTNLFLDASSGHIKVAPDARSSTAIAEQIKAREKKVHLASAEAATPCVSADGQRIEVFANLAAGDAKSAVSLGAEGCGLLRSEFLYLDRPAPPNEDEQHQIYQNIADELAGRPLVIRTLDIGADKQVPFMDLGSEENPALGLRGIRLTLKYRELLESQLRAILRVDAAGPVHIMLPMVSSLDELQQARTLTDQLAGELGISERISLGVMIETPASVMIADQLAKEADFFSIGTNDLTQYCLAMDRGNAALAAQVDSLHPSVLRMIKLAVEAGRSQNKWVGVCGGMAADPVAVPILLGLGVEELSGPALRLATTKAIIRELDVAQCRAAIGDLLNLSSAQAVREFALETWPVVRGW